jgi:hypothetical protein
MPNVKFSFLILTLLCFLFFTFGQTIANYDSIVLTEQNSPEEANDTNSNLNNIFEEEGADDYKPFCLNYILVTGHNDLLVFDKITSGHSLFYDIITPPPKHS